MEELEIMFEFNKGKQKWNCCDELVAKKDLEKHIKENHWKGEN